MIEERLLPRDRKESFCTEKMIGFYEIYLAFLCNA
jgi:hypothetical protein